MLDELKALAAEAKAKGGAQHCDDQPSVNLRLKWLGLFHRDKYTPGTQQLKTPYTSGLRPHTLVL
jgi:hypothetical protein